RAGVVGVLEGVARAIDTRSLAVPHAVDAIVPGAGIEMDLLGAPQGGRGQILVGAGLEFDVVLLDEALGLPEGLVEAAKWRAAIARDVAGRVEAGGQIPLALHHGQANQRLRAGQIDPPAFEYILVVEGYRLGHGPLPDRLS